MRVCVCVCESVSKAEHVPLALLTGLRPPPRMYLPEALATHTVSALHRAQVMSEPKESTYHLRLSHSAREPIQEETISAEGGLQVLLNQLHHHLITHLIKEEGGTDWMQQQQLDPLKSTRKL